MKIAESLQPLSAAKLQCVSVGGLFDAPVTQQPAHCPAPHGQPGFTLIELITTMLIIGILAVVVLPRFDLLQGFDEVGYRDKVRATLEYARKSAVAQRRITCVAVDSFNSVTSIRLTIDNVTPEATGIPAPGGCPRDLDLLAADSKYCGASPPLNRVCAPTASIVLSGPNIRFDALGRPQDSTGALLTSAASYSITNISPNITVEAETGYVH